MDDKNNEKLAKLKKAMEDICRTEEPISKDEKTLVKEVKNKRTLLRANEQQE